MSRIQNKKTGVRHIIIDSRQENRRIDNFLLSELKGLPKTRIYQMIRRGEIRVNGGRKKQLYRLQAGDKVRIPPVLEQQSVVSGPPQDYLQSMVRNSLIYEDNNLIVLNKPAGIVVHSGSGRNWGVIEVLRHLRPSEQDLQLVHRLDRETSGCLLIARNISALQGLHKALKAGDVEKHYTALIKGHLDSPGIEISLPLRKQTMRSGERMVEVSEQGKQALSRFEILKQYKDTSLVKVHLVTGRTHQIRVHASYEQHPLAGDTKYGDKEFNKQLRQSGLRRLFLHASMLRLPSGHGLQGQEFNAPLPEELNNFLSTLG